MNDYTKIIIVVLLFSLGPLLVRLIDLDGISKLSNDTIFLEEYKGGKHR
ncbi:MAG: hypothetical protein PHV16_05250 [Candidatus Nanoarchaeia archaeon]|nr:hypothetical protein [Candidatus Nanoarchaeia archaeon]